MNKCNNCREFFDDEERVLIYDDPSPSGISLPAGHMVIAAYCPHCGSEDWEENFSLADEIDIREEDYDSALISYEGNSFRFYLNSNGEMEVEPVNATEDKKGEAQEVA